MAAPVPSAPLSAADAPACAQLLGALPDEIDPGVQRRPVVDDAGRFAAWGDPAVVLECGAAPGDPAEQPVSVNRVGWTVRDVGAGFRWTTVNLGIVVAVDVPDAYPNGAELVNPLAAPLQATLPVLPSPSPAR